MLIHSRCLFAFLFSSGRGNKNVGTEDESYGLFPPDEPTSSFIFLSPSNTYLDLDCGYVITEQSPCEWQTATRAPHTRVGAMFVTAPVRNSELALQSTRHGVRCYPAERIPSARNQNGVLPSDVSFCAIANDASRYNFRTFRNV